MRRYDKKQNILEANLRLENRFLSDDEELDNILEEVMSDFNEGLSDNINEGFTVAAIGMALAGGKLLDLLGSGLKKLTNWLVKKGIISKNGKSVNTSEKVSNWLTEKGEWWSKKIMSFFNWVAGALVDHFMKKQNPHLDQGRLDDAKKKLGLILFYLTITSVGLTAISQFSSAGAALKGIESVAISIKGYELSILVFGLIIWVTNKILQNHPVPDVIHALEQCVEGDASRIIKGDRVKITECTIKQAQSHGSDDHSEEDTESEENIEQ